MDSGGLFYRCRKCSKKIHTEELVDDNLCSDCGGRHENDETKQENLLKSFAPLVAKISKGAPKLFPMKH